MRLYLTNVLKVATMTSKLLIYSFGFFFNFKVISFHVYYGLCWRYRFFNMISIFIQFFFVLSFVCKRFVSGLSYKA